MSMVPLRSSSPLHDVVGDDLEHEALVARAPAEVAGEGRQFHAVVDRVADEAIRAGADGVLSEGDAGPVRHDLWHDQVDGKRSEALLQTKHHLIAAAGLDRLDRSKRPFVGRDEAGIQEAAIRVRHVGRRQLVAVVEEHAALQRDHVGRGVRLFEALGQVRRNPEGVVPLHQAVEHQLVGACGDVVGADAGVEVVRAVGDADDQDVGVRRRPAQAGR